MENKNPDQIPTDPQQVNTDPHQFVVAWQTSPTKVKTLKEMCDEIDARKAKETVKT